MRAPGRWVWLAVAFHLVLAGLTCLALQPAGRDDHWPTVAPGVEAPSTPTEDRGAPAPVARVVTDEPRHPDERRQTGERLELCGVVSEEPSFHPLAGATVHLDAQRRGELTVTTDAKGEFRLRVDPTTFVALRVDAPGRAPEELGRERWPVLRSLDARLPLPPLRPDGCAAREQVVLRPGFEVTGRVTANSQPLADARVRCVQRGHHGTARLAASALTGADGRFTVGCAEGEFKVQATHPAYRRAITDWLTATAARTPSVELALEPGAVLSGVVVDDAGGPVRGVWLSLRAPSGPVQLHSWSEDRVLLPDSVVSADDGSFRFGPARGALVVSARSVDHRRAELPVELGDQDVRVEVRLEAGNHIAGVVTLDGAPAEHVAVGWSCNGRSPSGLVLSGRDGRFQLNQLRETNGCLVVARPEGEDPLWQHPGARGGFLTTGVPAAFGDANVVLALTSEAAGVLEVTFTGTEATYSGELQLSAAGEVPRTVPLYARVPGATIDGLRPGRYRLSARLNDGVDPSPLEVDVLRGTPTRVSLVVPDGFRRGRATGRVVDAVTGAPIAGASVWYSEAPKRGATQALADANGGFAFDFAAQRLEVTVSAPGYEQRSLRQDVGAGASAALGDVPLVRAGR